MIRYSISLQEFLNAQRLAAGHKRWFILTCLFLGLILFCIKLNTREDGSVDMKTLFILLALVCPGVAYGATVGVKRRLSKIYKEQKALQSECTLDFDAEGIHWASEYGTSLLPWRDVFKYKNNRELILIYQSSAIYHLIPIRAFEAPSALQRFLDCLKAGRCEQVGEVDGATPRC
jgi:hypothetical protein